MKIRIKDNAYSIATANIVCGGPTVSPEWGRTLYAIQGTTIEVDTKFLFGTQYNTVPVPGVSAQGLRIMDNMVADVIEDEREGKARCDYCGKVVVDDTLTTCPHCETEGFVKPFAPFLAWRKKAKKAKPITLGVFVARNKAKIDQLYAAECNATVAEHRRNGWCNNDEREMAVANIESLYHWALTSGVVFD